MLHQERSGSTVRCDSLARMEAQDEEFEGRPPGAGGVAGGEG
ncbi:MAG: hypothetical protein WBK56_05070 [Methanoculleus sp.]